MEPKRPNWLWAPVVLVAALIVVGACLPGSAIAFALFTGADKLAHGAEFLVLGFITQRAVCGTWPGRGRSFQIAATAAAVGLFALATELGQIWVPMRSPELADLAVDLAALVGGLAMWYLWAARADRARRRGRPVGTSPEGRSPDAR